MADEIRLLATMPRKESHGWRFIVIHPFIRVES